MRITNTRGIAKVGEDSPTEITNDKENGIKTKKQFGSSTGNGTKTKKGIGRDGKGEGRSIRGAVPLQELNGALTRRSWSASRALRAALATLRCLPWCRAPAEGCKPPGSRNGTAY